MFSFKGVLTGLLLGSLSLGANALVMQEFEQAPAADGYGNLSDYYPGAQVADNFQFSNDVTLKQITWWGSYDGSPFSTELFTVRIFADNGAGSPETSALFETNFSGSGGSAGGLVDAFGASVFSYDVAVSWALTGGQDYYLSVFNNDDPVDPADPANDWYWLESAVGDTTGWSRIADVDSWSDFNPDDVNMSFHLTAEPVVTGNVPEPSPLVLVALFSLYLLRARKRGRSLD